MPSAGSATALAWSLVPARGAPCLVPGSEHSHCREVILALERQLNGGLQLSVVSSAKP